MTITYHPELIQGSEEWHAARCGLLTASEMKLIVAAVPEPETRIKVDGTPYKQREWKPAADTDKCRAHLWELLAQRITRYVEPSYIGDDMLRGQEEEVYARLLYAEHYAPVDETGFVTNDEWGFTLGFSPDGLVGDAGFIETKSRRQKYQAETLVEYVATGTIPPEFVFQVQTGLLVTRRKWCDFLSYTGGFHMAVIRVYPDPVVQAGIIEAATDFERRAAEKMVAYRAVMASNARILPTVRRIQQEMYM